MTRALRALVIVLTMRNLARLVVIAAVIAACNNIPSSPPSRTASGTSGPVPTAAGPGATSGIVATDAPADAASPTSMSKITDALASGAIDEPTSLLYRLYASVGDDRLPAEYEGAWTEDAGAGHRVREIWDTLSADHQASLLPFMVRPTSTRSVWAPPASASSGRPQLASVRLAATACENGFLRKQVSSTVPIVVWGQCGAMAETAVAAEVDEVAQDMAELWGPMTTYMGEPIGDTNLAGDAFVDSPEGGDGMIDIYLVAGGLNLHGRDIFTDALGATHEWPPFVGSRGTEASSAYIVINTGNVTGIELRSTLAHEFFHVLEYAHNNNGTWDGSHFIWFLEASAVWAQDEFVPESSATKGYLRFTRDFQSASAPLWFIDGQNEYASFAWPLFMEQELGRPAVATAWRRFEGVSGYDNLTAALDGMLSFKDRFRDFAVRVWNEDLQPGDPAAPRFQVLDPKFPTSQPRGSRADGRTVTTADLPVNGFVQSTWSYYLDLVAAQDVKSMTFDFTPMSISEELDVDLLLKVNGTWQRKRPTMGGEEKFCDASEAIVVISNHSTVHQPPTQASFDVRGDANACNAKGSWSATLTGPMPGAGSYTGTGDVACAAAPNGPGGVKWTATGMMLSSDISQLLLQQNDTFDSISVQTPGGIEGGLWHVDGTMPSATVVVSGSGDATSGAHVSGHATWTDMEGNRYTADVSVDCAEVYTSP